MGIVEKVVYKRCNWVQGEGGRRQDEVNFCCCGLSCGHDFGQPMCDCLERGWEAGVVVSITEGFLGFLRGNVAPMSCRRECVIKKVLSFQRKIDGLMEGCPCEIIMCCVNNSDIVTDEAD